MKNLIIYTLMFTLSMNLWAQDFSNIREADSVLIPKNSVDEIARLYKGTKAEELLKNIMTDKKINRCATSVISTIEKSLNLNNTQEVEKAVLGLRLNDSIDDIAADLLIRASKIKKPIAHPIAKNDLTPEEEEKAMAVFSTKASELKNKSACIEDTYRALVFKLGQESIKFRKELKTLNKLALEKDIISEIEFKKIEKMRAGKVHEWPLTLSAYGHSLEILAKNFPNRVKESSPLITDDSIGKFGNKKSLRRSLHEKFNSTQIMLLANVVRDLKKRLEAKDITINITYVEQQTEIINLAPMEKFRFILKLLRKELATLNNSSLLNGNRANYIDIISASYEVGYISADEIAVLASLEDIWNPKKTTKEKVMVWAKRFGSVASVLLPPPFGFVSVLAIMLIDQYIQEAPVERDLDYNIF